MDKIREGIIPDASSLKAYGKVPYRFQLTPGEANVYRFAFDVETVLDHPAIYETQK